MRTLLHWTIAMTLVVPRVAAQPWRVDPTRISQAAQDGTGQVWGITYAGSPGLHRWEDDSWKSVAVTGVPIGTRNRYARPALVD